MDRNQCAVSLSWDRGGWGQICELAHSELNENDKISGAGTDDGKEQGEVNLKESVGREEHSLVDHLQWELLDLRNVQVFNEIIKKIFWK